MKKAELDNYRKTVIDDGFYPYLVDGASFESDLEFPFVNAPDKIIIPKKLVPFTRITEEGDPEAFVMFYEHDYTFFDVIVSTRDMLKNLRKYGGIISVDSSLNREMPLIVQLINIYINRQIAYFYQKNELYTIPNVRWGDERTYTNMLFKEPPAFSALPKNSIYAVGAYGAISNAESKYHFRKGLEAMLDYLQPKTVLVYGAGNKKLFSGLEKRTQFVFYEDWISSKRRKSNG